MRARAASLCFRAHQLTQSAVRAVCLAAPGSSTRSLPRLFTRTDGGTTRTRLAMEPRLPAPHAPFLAVLPPPLKTPGFHQLSARPPSQTCPTPVTRNHINSQRSCLLAEAQQMSARAGQMPDGAAHRQVVVVVRILVRVRVLRVLAAVLAGIADVAVATVCLELLSLGARHLANLRAHECHRRSTRTSALASRCRIGKWNACSPSVVAPPCARSQPSSPTCTPPVGALLSTGACVAGPLLQRLAPAADAVLQAVPEIAAAPPGRRPVRRQPEESKHVNRLRTACGVWYHIGARGPRLNGAPRCARLVAGARGGSADSAWRWRMRRGHERLEPALRHRVHLAKSCKQCSRGAQTRIQVRAEQRTFCTASSALLDTSARNTHQPSSLLPGKNGVRAASGPHTQGRGTTATAVSRWCAASTASGVIGSVSVPAAPRRSRLMCTLHVAKSPSRISPPSSPC